MAESQFDVEGALTRLEDARLPLLPPQIPNVVDNEHEDEHESVPVDHPNPQRITSGISNEHQQLSRLRNAADLANDLIAFQERERNIFCRGGPDFSLSRDVEHDPEDCIWDQDEEDEEDEDQDEEDDEDEDQDEEDDGNMEQADSENESMEQDSPSAGPPIQTEIQDPDSEVQALQAVVSAVRLPASVVAPSPLPSSQLPASNSSDLTICQSSMEPVTNLAGVHDGASISFGISEVSTSVKEAAADADGSNNIQLEGESTGE